MKKLILMSLWLILGLLQTVAAQDRTISGRVTDRTSGEGLPGVTVLLKGTSTGVSSNADGGYSLSVPTAGGTLVFSSVNYTSLTVPIGSSNVINAGLAVDATQLSEAVVVGYGQQQDRRDIIGAVTTVRAAEFANQPILGADQALQGRAAGVQVTQASGTPGGGVSVRVRGSSSIGAGNEPLYVVDGLPIITGSASQLGVGNQTTNALADINPNDIESLEVLKDAAAAAIYGSRASNGVVLITTKRGKAGRTQVALDYYTGVQSVWKRPAPLTGQQQVEVFLDMVQNRFPRNAAGEIRALGVGIPFRSYADVATAAFNGNAGLELDANGLVIANTPANGVRELRFFQNPATAPSTNYSDLIFRDARISKYGLNFSGGSDKSRFRISTEYFDQAGTIIGSGFERASARLSLDNNLNDKIRMGTSIGLSRSTNQRIQNDNNINGVLSAAILVASDIPVRQANGTYAKDPGGSTENPIVAATEPFIESVNDRMIGTFYTEFEFIKNLKYRATFGLDYLASNDQRFLPTTTNTGAGVNGQATEANLQAINFNHISSLNYSRTFAEDHSFSGLFVVEFQRDANRASFLQSTGFPGNTVRQISAGAISSATFGSATSSNLIGTLLKLNYAFKDRYLLSGSVRRDGSSKFGGNEQYGTFPAVSVGWRVSQENFLKDQTVASELKLRASYGQTGNQAGINDFASRGLIFPGANYQGIGGLVFGQLENRSLKWERTAAYNIGADIGFLQNRIYLSADVYQKKTNDLLLGQPLTADTGFLSYQNNVGNIENKGVELAINTINLRSQDERGFQWETNFNITANRNKVTKLVNGTPIFAGFGGGTSRVIEGQPLGAFFGFRVARVFQTAEEIAALNGQARAKFGPGAFYQNASTSPGDLEFRDLNGDGRINGDDQEVLGNAQPKFFGGITNTFRYMGFDFSALFQYNMGNDIYNNNIAFAQGMNAVFGQDKAVLNRWTPTNRNTNIPRAIFQDPSNNRRQSDRFVENGSYGRFKLVTLGYTLPKTLMSTLHVSTARVYVQAQNLITFTNYSGLDPEVNTFSGSSTSLGTDFLTYPQARVLMGGITVGF